MRNSPKLASREECMGCHACEAACPEGSITFSGKGFFTYPEVNTDTCIGCGKCEKACDYVRFGFRNDKKDFTQRFFCAHNTYAHERCLATSGGVSGALAARAIQLGWQVCGVAFDEEMNVAHIISDDAEILEKIRGSKYVQSNVAGIYAKAIASLRAGQQVLFIGTPCQCQAMSTVVPAFLRSGLLTCAIICHGVNSPKVWHEYVDFIEKKKGRKLQSYNFRSKDRGWGFGIERAAVKFENSRVKYLPSWKNLFMRWFGMHYILQESCFHCPYRIEERYSDMTIGDFWGIEKLLPQEPTREGVSVLIVSTERAMEFVNGVENLSLKETSATLTPQKSLGGFTERRSESQIAVELERRQHFEEEYLKKGFVYMAAKYPPQNTLQRILYHFRYRLRQYGIVKGELKK